MGGSYPASLVIVNEKAEKPGGCFFLLGNSLALDESFA